MTIYRLRKKNPAGLDSAAVAGTGLSGCARQVINGGNILNEEACSRLPVFLVLCFSAGLETYWPCVQLKYSSAVASCLSSFNSIIPRAQSFIITA